MMLHRHQDTIAAVASPTGGAARGILRISGDQTISSLAACFIPSDPAAAWANCQQPTCYAGKIATELLGEIDVDLYLWPGNKSFTREPSAELHTLGSAVMLDAILRTLLEQGIRLADPGEFTLRAFLGGRIDLTQAEAILGVIDAENEKNLNIALRQLAGGLSTPLSKIRDQLLELCAHLEAGLDFVEEDIEFISAAELVKQCQMILESINQLQQQMKTRETIPQNYRVVLWGLPNAGKSSLLNAIVAHLSRATANRASQAETPSSDGALVSPVGALVSPVAGTTRDYLSRHLVIDTVAVELIDTAGIQQLSSETPSQAIPHQAQQQTDRQQQQADLVLCCLDSTKPLPKWLQEQLQQHRRPNWLMLFTKGDLSATPVHDSIFTEAIITSSQTGQGIEKLCQQIRERLTGSVQRTTESPSQNLYQTSVRCRQSLLAAQKSVENGIDIAKTEGGDELVSAELRLALNQLGTIVGTIYTDDLLDQIFGQFCIGK